MSNLKDAPYLEYTHENIPRSYVVFSGYPGSCKVVLITRDEETAIAKYNQISPSFALSLEGGNWMPLRRVYDEQN